MLVSDVGSITSLKVISIGAVLLTLRAPFAGLTDKAVNDPAPTGVPLVPVVKLLENGIQQGQRSDPRLRYQSARDIIHDLEAWRAGTNGGLATSVRRRMHSASLSNWIALGVVVLVVALLAVFFRAKPFSGSKPVSAPAMSLAILPFRNTLEDPSLTSLRSRISHIFSTHFCHSP